MTEPRDQVTQAQRIVVKIGSSSLTGEDGHLNETALGNLVEALSAWHARGKQVVLVTSGSIAAGIGPLGLPARPRSLKTAQATASVGQGMLIAAYSREFASHGLHVGQVLLTEDDVVRRGHYGNAERALEQLLALDVVPIVNENDTVATDEIRFGDNDRLAALVATVVKADALVLLTDVDSLYTAAPGTPGARRIDVVHGPEDLGGIDVSHRGSALGTGGMVTKLEAATIATSSGVLTVLTSANSITQVLEGEPVGTLFMPTGRHEGARLTWLAHAARTEGQLILDAGAVAALEGRRASLLAAGVRAVRGEFDVGDPIELVGPDRVVVARGLSAFASHEIPQMLGQTTDQLREELGEHFARPIVHIDDLVVIAP
ncbi:glutamate 5-kinase [Demequina sediminicola]|uniref:glutamate 5-kinase n=1 Tax=Demequina sediminicola TaxID=1095026 RepID=UPI000B2EBA5F|nr:glutamate 5-kinase [Demequina sediminicola]